jgi:hypothetical protein
LAAVGDVTGDGISELLIGAFSGGAGRAYLVSGAVTGSVDLLAESLLVLNGEQDYSYAGMAVSAGDTDGDGLPELAVGAPLDDQGGLDSGVVWLVSGELTGTQSLGDAYTEIHGERTGDFLGAAVAFADLDGDGVDDLVIGATGHGGTQEAAGVVAIFVGNPQGDLLLSDAFAQLQGLESSEFAGTSSSAGGDYNGDGHADLLVGSPYREVDAGTAGAAYLILGPVPSTATLTLADAHFWGESEGDLAGASVALIGDQDGDGWGELLVGAPGAAQIYGFSGGIGL